MVADTAHKHALKAHTRTMMFSRSTRPVPSTNWSKGGRRSEICKHNRRAIGRERRGVLGHSAQHKLCQARAAHLLVKLVLVHVKVFVGNVVPPARQATGHGSGRARTDIVAHGTHLSFNIKFTVLRTRNRRDSSSFPPPAPAIVPGCASLAQPRPTNDLSPDACAATGLMVAVV